MHRGVSYPSNPTIGEGLLVREDDKHHVASGPPNGPSPNLTYTSLTAACRHCRHPIARREARGPRGYRRTRNAVYLAGDVPLQLLFARRWPPLHHLNPLCASKLSIRSVFRSGES